MSTSTRRRPDLGAAKVPGRQRRRRAAGRPAERQRHRYVRGRRGHPLVPLDRRRRHLAGLGRGRERQPARCGRQPAHVAASLSRGCRRRQGLRRLARLRIPLGLHFERHRLQHLARRRRVDRQGRGSRSTRHRAASTTSSPASRSTARPRAAARGSRWATTTTRSRRAGPPPRASSRSGLRLSTDGGATWTQPRKVAGPISLSWIASTNQGVMVGDYMSTSFAGANYAFPIFAVAKLTTGSVFDERMYSARFDVTVARAACPRAARPHPVLEAQPGARPRATSGHEVETEAGAD